MCQNCASIHRDMGKLNVFTTRLATLLVLHAAGAGLASPTVLVTRPVSRVVEWLPIDNQTVYTLGEGETRSLELNTSSTSQTAAYISISSCTKDLHWGLYHGLSGNSEDTLRKNWPLATPETHERVIHVYAIKYLVIKYAIRDHLTLLKEYTGVEMKTYSVVMSRNDRYLLQLSSMHGGGAAVSVRGEAYRTVRMRLRVRSRRRLSANWDPSPIDPQETTYCVVASHLKNYTSLCAAQYDLKTSRLEKPNRFNPSADSLEFDRMKPKTDNVTKGFAGDNKILNTDSYSIFEGDYNNVYRRKKFSRSTKVTDEDPVIACVGERTHHLIENLDPSTTYYVNVFGVARDRRAGSLLASGSVRPRTSTAKRLRENVPHKSDIRNKNVYYFKATIGTGGGLWLAVSTCGGVVDIEVLVRGKRLYLARNIDPQLKFFVPAPIPNSSIQETSDEGSVQFDSSSEEARMRYVIKVVPSRWETDNGVSIEITASTTRWGINSPELSQDGAVVRELRPRRSCKSVDIAFLPASHHATDVIRYCILARDLSSEEDITCTTIKKSVKTQCINHMQTPPVRVITQKITGLKAGRKYAIQVTASMKGSSVPYNVLYADTNASCKGEK